MGLLKRCAGKRRTEIQVEVTRQQHPRDRIRADGVAAELERLARRTIFGGSAADDRYARQLLRERREERFRFEIVGIGKDAEQVVRPKLGTRRRGEFRRDLARAPAKRRREKPRRVDCATAEYEHGDRWSSFNFASRGDYPDTAASRDFARTCRLRNGTHEQLVHSGVRAAREA